MSHLQNSIETERGSLAFAFRSYLNSLDSCHPERKGPQAHLSLGVVSRRICVCTSFTTPIVPAPDVFRLQKGNFAGCPSHSQSHREWVGYHRLQHRNAQTPAASPHPRPHRNLRTAAAVDMAAVCPIHSQSHRGWMGNLRPNRISFNLKINGDNRGTRSRIEGCTIPFGQ